MANSYNTVTGGRAGIATRLGDDEIGGLAIRQLRDAGVEIDLVRISEGGRSGFSSVYVDQLGERQIVSFRGSGLAESLGPASLGSANAVLADTRWLSASATVLRHARSLGVPGVLDAEAPVSGELASLASHVAISAQGLAAYADSDDLPEALAIARRRISGWVCATDGARGVFFFEGDSLRQIRPPEVDADDTLGAGDIWHGAFTLRLAEGAEEPIAVRFANAAAAIYCTRAGKRDGSLSRENVDSLADAAYR